MADDAARLPRAVRPLPQLSDPVARVAGEGARAGAAADAVSATARGCFLVPFGEIQQQVVLSVRAAAARRHLPPADDADRRGRSRAQHRAGALVTGEVVGQVASQTIENLTAINEVATHAGAAAAHRHGQGRDHRRGAAARHLSRSRSSPTRTAARCSRRKHPATKARRADVLERRSGARRSTRSSSDAVAAAVVEDFRVSCKIDVPHGCDSSPCTYVRRADDVKFTPGKLAGMKAVSNERGVIAAAAMDQRGSLQKALAKEKGGDVGDHDIEEFKSLVTEVLTPHASAILLDPEWGLPASKRRAKNAGLLHGLREDRLRRDRRRAGCPICSTTGRCAGSRKPAPTASRSCSTTRRSIRRTINDKKHAWVERIGDECRANDIPFFLEFVGYEEGADEKGLEFAKKKPRDRHRQHGRVHQGSLRRRRHEGRGADQHEVRRGHASRSADRRPTRSRKRWTASAARPTSRPSRSSICRPASATQEFTESLELAAEAGHAVLGRAVRPRDVEGRDRRSTAKQRRRRVPDVAARSRA